MKLNILRSILSACLLAPLMAAHAAPTHEFMLSNGMKVIVLEDHRTPAVTQMLWYKVGAIDEVNGRTGLSHALEHMMFKATKRHPTGDFSRLVARMGGSQNAFTSKDATVYFQRVDQSKLASVMALEADRMSNLQFNQHEFASEIRVVMEERRWRTDDQPQGMAIEALQAAAFTAHPYHHPVIGWMDDLEHLTLSDVQTWYRSWYAPNNATLVIAGDVNAEQVRVLAQRYFGAIAAKKLPVRKPQNEPEQRGIRRTTVKASAENPFVILAFKAPVLRDVEKDDDVFALSVLSAVLDGYDNARLKARLVRGDKIANSAGSGYDEYTARGPALFVLEGAPVAGVSTSQLETALRAEVTRIATQGVEPAELQRIKTQLIASRIYGRDSVFARAMEIGGLESAGISYRQLDRIIERIRDVTAQQVQAAAQKYFGDDGLTVVTLQPLPLNGRQAPPPPALLH
ncbi:pitrilysin family protein [Herbaspirillum sp. RTI4]|uniref:M16 family metallopeptidase n=1 Tax=Herbaspirillum sp. RTI4 TaxID=3048640 RepID=UPI002AB3CD2C|nr:pitrilysin family protein [Herbaspirillum sp. RTI4]MDY7577712.1 pitrilysin family protein [Herbaspirillum sp. RTI4]MEA9980860.1 pitrilysin family protein [Herbaspirillum sp. RTI4]